MQRKECRVMPRSVERADVLAEGKIVEGHVTSPRVTGFNRSLVEIPLRKRAKDPHRDGCENDGTDEGLNEDGILDLAQRRFLDPYFAVEYLADDVALLVLDDPRFIFVAVVTTHTLERVFLHLV